MYYAYSNYFTFLFKIYFTDISQYLSKKYDIDYLWIIDYVSLPTNLKVYFYSQFISYLYGSQTAFVGRIAFCFSQFMF